MQASPEYIESQENPSLSYLSTPDFKNDSPINAKNSQSIILEKTIQNKIPNSYQKFQESKLKTCQCEKQHQNGKLFLPTQELDSDQSSQHIDQSSRRKTTSKKISQKDGYTPETLLEKLKNFKNQKENYQTNNSSNWPFQFTANSKVSLIALQNPYYRYLQQVKKRRWERLTISGLGWKDRRLYEDIPTGEFYIIPDDADIIESKNSSFEKKDNLSDSQVKNDQGNMTEKLGDPENLFEEIPKNQSNQIPNSSSNSIMNRVNKQLNCNDSLIVRLNTSQMTEKIQETSKNNYFGVNVQIQTDLSMNQVKEIASEKQGNLSNQQFNGLIFEQIKVLEEINNTQSLPASVYEDKKQSNKEQKILKDSLQIEMVQNPSQQNTQKILYKSQQNQEIQQNQSEPQSMDQRKYLEQSYNKLVMDPQFKKKILLMFNKQLLQMHNKLSDSMHSSSSQSQQNSQNFIKSKTKSQEKVFQSQLCFQPSDQLLKSKISDIRNIKQSEINFNPPEDQQVADMTFLKKNYEDIESLDPSNIMYTSSQEKVQILKTDGQFEKLEELMRERGMTKSIFSSNPADSSYNNESIVQIVDPQTAEKFKKFNPGAFKKDSMIQNNQ